MQINEDIHVHGLEELLLSKCPFQTIHRTRVTTIKLSIAYFTDIGKKVLNSLWNHKRPCLAKAILGKKQANVRRGQQRAIRAGESIEEEKEKLIQSRWVQLPPELCQITSEPWPRFTSDLLNIICLGPPRPRLNISPQFSCLIFFLYISIKFMFFTVLGMVCFILSIFSISSF